MSAHTDALKHLAHPVNTVDPIDAKAEYDAACASLRAYRTEGRYSGAEMSERLERYQRAAMALRAVGGPWLK